MRLFLIILVLFPVLLWGQEKDAIQSIVQNAEKELDAARYDEAISLAEEALASIGDKVKTEKGRAYNVLGYAFLDQGDLEKGRGYFEKAMESFEKLHGQSHPAIAQTWNNLGNYHLQKGDFVAAIEAYQVSANMRVELLGLDHEKTADALDNIGLGLAGLGDYAQAFAMHRQALDIRLKVLGKKHPDIAQSYHNMGNCYYYSGAMEEAQDYYEKCLQLRVELLGEQHPKTAQAYNNRGNVFLQNKEILKASTDYEKALQINEQQYGEEHPAVAECRMNLGNCAAQDGQFDRASTQYLKALAIQRPLLGSDHPNLANTYDNLGHCFLESGDIGEALDYYEQSAAIRKVVFEKGHPYLSYNYENLGLCYQAQGDYQNAVDYHLKSLDIRLNVFGDKNELVAGNYNNLGNSYFEKEDYKNALFFYKKSLPLFKGKQSLEYLTAAANIGRSYAEIGESKKAINYYQSALKAKLPPNHPHLATVRKDMALALAGLKDHEGAIAQIDQAKSILMGEERRELELERVSSPMILLDVLMAEGDIYKQKHELEKELGFLEKSQSAYAKASDLIDFCFLLYQNFLSKKIINEYNFSLQGKRIQHSPKLKAYQIAEKSRNLLLLQAVQKSKAFRKDSLTHREIELSQQLAAFDKKRIEADLNPKALQALVDASFQTKKELRSTIQQIEKQNPKLYRAKYQHIAPSPQEIQERLEEDQALIQYFVGDSTVHAFIFKKDSFYLHKNKLDIAVKPLIQQFEDGVKYYFESGNPSPDLYLETINQYCRTAYEIYSIFFKPLEQYQLPPRLVIVPDGGLGFIPFSALLKSMPESSHKFKTHDYLLKHHSFSYAYSANLWLEMQAQTSSNNKLIAFAPDFNTGEYHKLKYNTQEASTIVDIWGGTLIKNAEATATAFDSLAPNYDILHFATHGEANTESGDYSYMVFAADSTGFEKRYARDLYAMKLNNPLTVLSACETGNGKYWRGEGIISLARAFAYAGSASIITTLWSANDAKTAQLMPNLYQNIQSGQTKDIALQQAQLKLIASQAHNDAHPYYWSAFITIGDSKAFPVPWYQQIGIFYWAALLLATMGLILLLWIKKT